MMIYFILKKVISFLPTLFGVTILSFFLIRLVPGDPVMLLLGERGVDPQTYREVSQQLGFDKPLYKQYGYFVGDALRGDLGHSIVSKRAVFQEFWDRFPATLELGLAALFLAFFFGIPMGIMAALKRNSFGDYFLMGTSLVGYSMPIFWWGLILILIFSVHLGLTPVAGRIGVAYDIEAVTGFMLIDTLLSDEGPGAFLDALRHLILPAIAMGTIPLAVMARMTRSSMLEVLGEDYIRTAKARGLKPYKIMFVHALRNALIPIITVAGLLFGSIITGAILTETIFAWPGIGKWLVASINARDYPVIQGGILLIATLIITINMLVDFIYAWANPRMRN